MDWFNDDTFWQTFYPCMFESERFNEAEEEVDKVQQLVGVKEASYVLDLACGPGRHSIPFAERGCRVCAVDASRYLLDIAKQRSNEVGVEIEFVRQDMREFKREAEFDLAICMWTSFGYFDSPADDLKVLKLTYDNLTDAGSLVLDVVGKEFLVRNIQAVHLRECSDGSTLVERPLLENEMSKFSNEWTLIKNGECTSATFSHNVYTAVELRDRLLQVGFKQVDIMGDFEGSAYDLESERLIAIARK